MGSFDKGFNFLLCFFPKVWPFVFFFLFTPCLCLPPCHLPAQLQPLLPLPLALHQQTLFPFQPEALSMASAQPPQQLCRLHATAMGLDCSVDEACQHRPKVREGGGKRGGRLQWWGQVAAATAATTLTPVSGKGWGPSHSSHLPPYLILRQEAFIPLVKMGKNVFKLNKYGN